MYMYIIPVLELASLKRDPFSMNMFQSYFFFYTGFNTYIVHFIV